VNVAAASALDARRTGRIRLAGVAVLVALAAVIGTDAAYVSGIRSAWFDACQSFAPRIPKSAPAVVVAIDEKSLKAIGQWPWPRSVMAELVQAIHVHQPAAIALDILMPEIDASSPERLLARGGERDAALAAVLADRRWRRLHVAGGTREARCWRGLHSQWASRRCSSRRTPTC